MATVVRVQTRERWAVLDERGIPIGSVTAFLRYLESIERSTNTLKAYGSDLAHVFTFLELRSERWSAFDNALIAEFISYMRAPSGYDRSKTQRSVATVNRALASLASYARYLSETTGDEVHVRLISTGRAHRTTWTESGREVVTAGPRLRRSQSSQRLLSQSETRGIVDACGRMRDKFLFTLLYETGMRIGQALLLRHSDIRVAESFVRVEKRDPGPSASRNKSFKSASVPVPPHVIRLYGAYMHSEYGLIDSDFVFINLWSGIVGAPLSYDSVDKLVERISRRTNIDGWGAHSFRHTFVHRLLAAGVSMHTVSYLVTHQSVMTTIDTYGHMNIDDVRREIDASGIWR